jgi:TRAP-type uncharacterized transport system substrate-binding protein
MRKILILLLLTCCSASAIETIKISSGPKNSLYSTFGQELANYLNSEFAGKYEFESVESEGSVQNIFNLCRDSKNTRIAISQEDVLSLYNSGNNEFFKVPRKNNDPVTHLGRLFYEEVYHIARKDITDDLTNTVHVGGAESGSYATFTNYREKTYWNKKHLGNGIDLLVDSKISSLFIVTSTPDERLKSIPDFDNKYELREIFLNDYRLLSFLPSSRAVADSLSPSGHSFNTISIPAVLICNRILPNNIAERIQIALSDETILNDNFQESKDYILQFTNKIPKYSNRQQHIYTNLPIPPHPVVAVLVVGQHLYRGFLYALLAWISIWLLFTYITNNHTMQKKLINVKKHIHLVFAVMTLHLGFLLLIKWVEVSHFLKGFKVTESIFIKMNFWESFVWMLTFLSSGWSNDYPEPEIGKLFPTAIKLLWFLLVAYSGAHLVSHLTVLMQRKKKIKMNLKNHIVICNWSSRGYRLLELLQSCQEVSGKAEIIVLADKDLYPSLSHIDESKYYLVSKSPWEISGLEDAKVTTAKTVLIMQPDNCQTDQSCDPAVTHYSESADGTVMRTALSVYSYVLKKAGNKPDKVKCNILAEVFDPDKRDLLLDIGVHETIVSRDIGMSLLAQAVTCPGITAFFNEVMDPSPNSNEIYFVPVPESLQKKSNNFFDVMKYYLDHNNGKNPVTPIGVLFNKPVVVNGKRKHFFLNPDDWSFSNGDTLIVLADTDKIAQSIL